MDSNLCEKRLRNECIDRISDLPDEILGKILSYLSIKDVIATSILSTRWKAIFPCSIPLIRIHLDDSYKISDTSALNFLNFVDKLLNITLRDMPRVEMVGLCCKDVYGDDKIVSWVCAALRLNVKHLYLVYNLTDSKALFDILHGNLKLLDGCPVLDDLRIIAYCLDYVDTLYIQHPILNKLYIEVCWSRNFRVVIDAPNLEAFVHAGYFDVDYVLKNTGSLHSVCIDFDGFRVQIHGSEFRSKARQIAELTKACSSSTRLCFAGDSLEVLYRSSLRLPTFQNLTCLALGRMGSHGWRMLAQFLKSAPSLAILTFEQGLESTWAYADFESLPPSLLVCLELHVKKIEICEYNWRENESKLIEYFLKNGKVLQELIVHCLPHENTSDLEKLSMLPRHSEACRVLLKKDKNIRGKYRHSSCVNWL